MKNSWCNVFFVCTIKFIIIITCDISESCGHLGWGDGGERRGPSRIAPTTGRGRASSAGLKTKSDLWWRWIYIYYLQGIYFSIFIFFIFFLFFFSNFSINSLKIININSHSSWINQRVKQSSTKSDLIAKRVSNKLINKNYYIAQIVQK